MLRDTWTPFAKNLIIVSETRDPEFNTIVLPGLNFTKILRAFQNEMINEIQKTFYGKLFKFS